MTVMRRGNRLSVQPVTADEWLAILTVAGVSDPLGLNPADPDGRPLS